MKILTRIFFIVVLFLTIGAGTVTAPILVSTVHATSVSSGTTVSTTTQGTKKTLKTAPPISNGQKSMGPGKVLGEILNFILQLFAWFVGAIGVLLGVVVYHTILTAGSYINKLGAVRTAWEMFRDLGNIILIFGFIAIGIATILDNASYGAKKALPKLLIVAVMLNFSLFAAEFIVDTGNMFATQFYTQINGGSLPAAGISLSREPISNILMNRLRLTTTYYSASAAPSSKVVANSSQHWFITFMLGIILYVITAFVLGAIAIMLVARFVIIVFLLIVSPIGFIGLAGIPLISAYGKKWWKALTDQTILAPVLMLFLLVALKLVQSSAFKSNGSIAKATQQNSGADIASILLNFTIIIGLMLAALIISKSLSGKAASFAIGMSGKAVFGGLSFAGRHTIGRSAQRVLESDRFKNSRLANSKTFGRASTAALKFGAKSSFDSRGLMKKAGFNAGAASGRGGYQKAAETKIKSQEAHADFLKKKSLKERTDKEKAKAKETSAKENLVETMHNQKNDTEFMNARHGVDRASHESRVKNAEKAVEAQKAKAIASGTNNADLAKLEATLKKEKELHTDKLNEQKKELGDMKKAHAAETKSKEQEVSDATSRADEIDGAAKDRAKKYAGSLEKGLSGIFATNKIAAQNIKDTVGKSPDQKQVDALLKAIKGMDTNKDKS